MSRSTLKATDALDLSKRWAAGKAPAGHRPALLWLRLRRAVMRGGVYPTNNSGFHPPSQKVSESGSVCAHKARVSTRMVRDFLPSIKPQGFLLCAVAIKRLTLTNCAWNGG